MFYQSDGARLFYEGLGSGPNLVLLHPTPVDHRFWLPLIGCLPGSYRITIPDLRGHGLSEMGHLDSAGITVQRLASDIATLMNVERIERTILAGCSIGGYVVYELWRRIPERFAALALCNAKPQPDSEDGRRNRLRNIEKIGVEGPEGFLEQTVESLVSAGFKRREPGRMAELRSMAQPMTSGALISVQRGLMERPNSIPTLATITVPVMALAALEDRASTPEEMRAISTSVPGAGYRLMEDAGHFAVYEKAQEAAEILSCFFAVK